MPLVSLLGYVAWVPETGLWEIPPEKVFGQAPQRVLYPVLCSSAHGQSCVGVLPADVRVHWRVILGELGCAYWRVLAKPA